MKSSRTAFFALGASAILLSHFAKAALPTESDAEKAASLEAVLSQRLPADGPGVAVLVARDGKLLFAHGYGLADREKQLPVTPETKFLIGSVTKQFTAAAILDLAAKGKLSIDDPLAKYFPDYPNGAQITLHQLLNHTSGLPNYTNRPEYQQQTTHFASPAEAVAWFQTFPPDFSPGSAFRYCNTGYFLLGIVVEKASGQSLGDYLQNRFFQPLGLRETGMWASSLRPEHLALGYLQASPPGHPIPPLMAWEIGCGDGGLYSTLADLWRWTEALQNGKILPPEVLKTMLTEGAVASRTERPFGYGMGLARSRIGGLPAISHTGRVIGFESAVTWFPEQKTTIVALRNTSDDSSSSSSSPSLIAMFAEQAFLKEETKQLQVDPTVDPKIYADYVGRYDYPNTIAQITVDNGHLFTQLPGQDKFELFPSAPDAFFLKVVDAQVVFERDKTGKVVDLLHTQNGGTFMAAKLSEK